MQTLMDGLYSVDLAHFAGISDDPEFTTTYFARFAFHIIVHGDDRQCDASTASV